jgi:hypothetical protein
MMEWRFAPHVKFSDEWAGLPFFFFFLSLPSFFSFAFPCLFVSKEKDKAGSWRTLGGEEGSHNGA